MRDLQRLPLNRQGCLRHVTQVQHRRWCESVPRTRGTVNSVHLQDLVLKMHELFAFLLLLVLVACHADFHNTAQRHAARQEDRRKLDERRTLPDQDCLALAATPPYHARISR